MTGLAGIGKRSLMWMLMVVFTGVVLEGGLALASRISPAVAQVLVSPWVTVPPTIPDPSLVYRPNPEYPEHDARGFRNPAVPDRAELVALGDSMTYGVGVAPKESWPRQLATLAGRTMYNISYGGYGPVHSLLLWDEALSFQPHVVIEAVYVGNDLFDAFDLVYGHGRRPDLRTPDGALQAAVRVEELREPIARRVNRLWLSPSSNALEAPGEPTRRGEDPHPPDRLGSADALPAASERHPSRGSTGRWRWFEERSSLYALLRRTRFTLSRTVDEHRQPADREWRDAFDYAARHPGCCQIFDDGRFRTVMAGRYRLAALDLGDPRIQEGLQITERALEQMEISARSKGIRFLVLLLPTKEMVFLDRWDKLPAELKVVTANEEVVLERLRSALRARQIEYLEGLPVLRAALAAGRQPYPESRDGHPNSVGHEVLARALAGRLGWRTPQ